MKRLLASAAYRIAFAASLGFALAVLGIGAMSYIAVHNAFSTQLDETIDEGVTALMDEGFEGIPALAESIDQRERMVGNSLDYAVFDPHGRRVAGNLETPMPAAGWSRIEFTDPEEGLDPARAKTTMLPNGYRLVVAADLEPVEAIDQRLLIVFCLGFVAALVIGSGIAFILGGYLKKRLTQVETVASAFAGGDRMARAEVTGRGDEFDRSAAALNAMLDRIAALVANLKQVTSDLAHDMRTPLARLRSELEALHRAQGPEREAMIGNALDRTDDILALFGAILRIAELEEGELRKHFAPVALGPLVADLADMHVALAEDSGRVLEEAVCKDCRVVGDRELISQAVINLIENAVRHTPDRAHILIGARDEGDTCRVFVSDNGPGIAEDDRDRVTERFVRLDSARSSAGHGLGLSLVKAIAEAHGGRLELRDRAPGLDASLIFPKEPT
ncbi:HAMP domain-containing histidine kinase [Tsuneonella sp. YG55]|uniref:histidine kinase n=1 Tax=Tsuneonella litorea TaxID=2976475 RepID=A0A9X2W331_9SPHN|nr:HAMP domain-containing sensor histidine kinase [Tsuneonella litorea]MCT2560202.1 HAMP domain-containing histidine kinase [Tsuneonella litorea]